MEAGRRKDWRLGIGGWESWEERMEVGNPGGLEGVIGGQHSESTSPGMQHLRPPCNTARALTKACRARFMQHSKSTHQTRESWDEWLGAGSPGRPGRRCWRLQSLEKDWRLGVLGLEAELPCLG